MKEKRRTKEEWKGKKERGRREKRKKKEFVSSREISRQEKIPLHYLRRILQKLRREKLVFAREGVSGGVKIRKRPADISVSLLIKVFQDKIQLTECMFRKQICGNRGTCVLRKNINAIEKMVIAELESITIGSLMDELKEKKNETQNYPD